MEWAALEAALREKLPTSSVQKLDGFPCDSYSDFLHNTDPANSRCFTAYDHGAFEAVPSTTERMMHYVLTWSPALVAPALVATALVVAPQSNFWLLLGIPLAFSGFLLTTPGLMRSFGYLLLLVIGGSAVYNWF
jgi:hypothetical protein